jgi:K+-sensing histidine kinase KdpD
MPVTDWRRDLAAVTGGLLGVAFTIAVLRLVQAHPNPTIAALLLLLVVLAAATHARLRVSIGISVAAALAFNFFLLPPFHTLIVADPQNWVTLFVFVVVAVTASQLSDAVRQRAAEAEARKQKAEALRQRADLASALLASLSHDLRTPVTSVRVAVTNLQDEALPGAERYAQAQVALQELDRLTRFFQNILDMARIDAAGVPPERQWVSPSDVVDAAVAQAGPALDHHELSIDADDSGEVQLDPRLTSTAVRHVLENAARYSPAGSTISVRAWSNGSGTHFIVRDQGPGLAPGDLDQLFQPFYRGRAARRASGTGLGLAISRGLLAAEGGSIAAENVAGGGAQFTIDVPCAPRRQEAQAT